MNTLGFKPNIITFHLEATKSKEEVLELIKLIKESGSKVRTFYKAKYKGRRGLWLFTIYSYVLSYDG